MRRIFVNLLLILIFMLSSVGCANKNAIGVIISGSWYLEGHQEAAFVLYDDGSCEIAGEYGTGTWSIVNDNTLKLTNFYGESETASIISVEENCLTLGEGDNLIKFWKYPQMTE